MTRTLSISKWIWGLCATAGALVLITSLLVATLPEAVAQEGGDSTPMAHWGIYLAAALATGLSCIGAGIAVSQVGASAMAAIAEKPELFGKVLVILGLAEGIAIYGLIISIIIIAAL
ncbi:ATP synthase subunit C [Motiliproteus sp. SC1-56]|uniref:ATP synthase subunit C n=1 Tax=Motiliproteus sp. SC1-56 TaxID=2799565 RepID=UPI001A8D7582|nr:ATP synthase subunit C [Motiliproteus sp. SC1-56]